MNLQAHQIDATGSINGPRVVGYALGDELQRKLEEGFMCGGWSVEHGAYAVLRKQASRGRKSTIPPKLEREAVQISVAILTQRKRFQEIAAEAGVTVDALRKRTEHLRSGR